MTSRLLRPFNIDVPQTKHAREFKEAWYSIDGNTINRQVEIPTIYLQLKTTRKFPTNNDTMTNTNFQITLPSTSATQQSKHSNDAIAITQP